MEWIIPGTVLTARRDDPALAEEKIRAMFLAGGMMRSQVAAATGLEAHAVQNWVQRGFLPPPVNKRYSCRQFCRILIINMLKSSLPMEKICGPLTYINGRLDDESDDSIDDSRLYFAFLRVAAEYRGLMLDRERRTHCVQDSLADYQEPFPGAKQRVEQVLHIMLTAWASSQLRREAESLMAGIEQKGEI